MRFLVSKSSTEKWSRELLFPFGYVGYKHISGHIRKCFKIYKKQTDTFQSIF